MKTTMDDWQQHKARREAARAAYMEATGDDDDHWYPSALGWVAAWLDTHVSHETYTKIMEEMAENAQRRMQLTR